MPIGARSATPKAPERNATTTRKSPGTGARAPILRSLPPFQATTLLLEKLAARRDVDLGQLAREAGLGVDDGRDPLDVGLLGNLLLVVGDRLQGLLVGVEVRAAGLLAGTDDLLVEVADALGGLVNSGLALGGGGHVGTPSFAHLLLAG